MESKSQFTDKPNCGKKLIVEKKRAEKYGEKGLKNKKTSEKQRKTKQKVKTSEKKVFFPKCGQKLINSE